MKKLNPYAKAIGGAIAAAGTAFLAADAPLPDWAKTAITLIVTLSSVYFAANTPADQPA